MRPRMSPPIARRKTRVDALIARRKTRVDALMARRKTRVTALMAHAGYMPTAGIEFTRFAEPTDCAPPEPIYGLRRNITKIYKCA